MCKAIQAAEYLICVAKKEGATLNNSMLQKLLYIAQGYSLRSKDNKPLFEDDIVAWQCGPGVPVVYFTYNSCLTGVLPCLGMPSINEESKKILDQVLEDWITKSEYLYNEDGSPREKYHYEPAQENLTNFVKHSKPWIDAFDRGNGEGRFIFNSDISGYFIKTS